MVALERRVNSTAEAMSLLDLRGAEDREALVGTVLLVEAEPGDFCFCLAELRIMARMF